MKRVPLRNIASARAGDKGNTSNISVWVYDPRHYEDVRDALTPQRLKYEFPDVFPGEIERYELRHLHGLNFVCHQALEGGVNMSLNLDAHGKSFSFLLLQLLIDIKILNSPAPEKEALATIKSGRSEGST